MFDFIKKKKRQTALKIQYNLSNSDVNIIVKLEELAEETNKFFDGKISKKDIIKIFKQFNKLHEVEFEDDGARHYYEYLKNILITDPEIKKIIRKEKLKQINGEKKIKNLENHLNFIWSLIPDKPKYGEFNKVFPVKDNIKVLRNFENENKWFSIARYDTKEEGITVISMFASILDYFCEGWKLSIVTEGKENIPLEYHDIVGFEIIKYNQI